MQVAASLLSTSGADARARRVCLLSGGGDAPGVNAIVRPGRAALLGARGGRVALPTTIDNDLGGTDMTCGEVEGGRPGHLQRGGSPSALDRNLGSQMGVYAAELCHQREHGRRIVVRGGQLSSLSLALASDAVLQRRVDLDGQMVRTARRVGIELGEELELAGT